ncbi:MAG: hypothetical protein MJ252_01650, partial [archaeon]|nr:hypothetical protein [archaeon]
MYGTKASRNSDFYSEFGRSIDRTFKKIESTIIGFNAGPKRKKEKLYNPFSFTDPDDKKGINDIGDIFDPANKDLLKKKKVFKKPLPKKTIFEKKPIKYVDYTPGIGRYNPNIDLKFSRTITGPKWSTITGRKQFEESSEKFFPSSNQKMSKTMQGFKKSNSQPTLLEETKNISHNEENIQRKEETKELIKNLTFYKSNSVSDMKINPQTTKAHLTKKGMHDSILKNLEHNNQSELNKEVSFSQTPNMAFSFKADKINDFSFCRQSKRNPTIMSKVSKVTGLTSASGFSFRKTNHKFLNKCKSTPDFSKTTGREPNFTNRTKMLPALPSNCAPNYDFVREREKMMAIYYDQHKIKKFHKEKYEKLNFVYQFDYDKYFNCVNNNKEPKTPNFKLMTSRPIDNKDPLPSYMKNLFFKFDNKMFTADSLKMNNFSNGQFCSDYSSFAPKKTFNKKIKESTLPNDFYGTFYKSQLKRNDFNKDICEEILSKTQIRFKTPTVKVRKSIINKKDKTDNKRSSIKER